MYKTKKLESFELKIASLTRKSSCSFYRAFRSGLFRLCFGQNWYNKYKKYARLKWARDHLLQDRFKYCVRRIGNIVQSKLPDGIVVLQPLDSLQMNWEIFLDQVYNRHWGPCWTIYFKSSKKSEKGNCNRTASI